MGTACVDYYLAPASPWAYLGHERLGAILRAKGASLRVLPIDLGGKVFPLTGGLPLGQRAPQRQAYRLVELKRISEHLGAPLSLRPKFFPVSQDDAARLIVAVDQRDGTEAAFALGGAILAAVWVQERNIADERVLAQILDEQGLSAQRLEQSHSQSTQEQYEANTQGAIDAGVFGVPSYCLDGEIFWGQDRLDYLERALQRRAA